MDYEIMKLIDDNLSFSEVMKIIKKYDKLNQKPQDLKTVRIAVISTGSIQYFTKILKYVMLARGYHCEIFESGYDGINMNILDAKSQLYSFNPHYTIVIPYYLDIKEFPSIIGNQSSYDLFLKKAITYQNQIFNALMKINGAHTFYCNYVVPYLTECGSYESNTINSKNNYLRDINRKILEIKPKGFTIIDLDAYASLVGKVNWFDMTGYFLNKIPFNLDYILPVTNKIGRLIEALSGNQKKCLVLDLDNTLWGGVVGDLGPQGIVLDPNNPEGEAYIFFQKYIKALKDRGVILSVCSKNDLKIATAPFLENPNMILKMEDISCFIANWENKAENLKKISKDLNIGLESLVFFDDNPAEREIVRQYLPMVQVINVPEDVDNFYKALDFSGAFDWIDITKEDIGRLQTYKSNNERKKLEESFVDYSQYLKALQMICDVRSVSDKDIERFTQLINKSNQFNLRTIRYSDKEILDMLNNDRFILLYAKLKDKFSYYGIIACVILHIADNNQSCFIDTFVMSCRVLKRGVETVIMKKIKLIAEEYGIDTIKAEYSKTEKNNMVSELYETYGLDIVSDSGNKKVYTASLKDVYIPEHFISEDYL